MSNDPTFVKAGVPVTVTLNGNSATGTTDSFGNFSIVVSTSPLAFTTYPITASIAGAGQFAAATATSVLTTSSN